MCCDHAHVHVFIVPSTGSLYHLITAQTASAEMAQISLASALPVVIRVHYTGVFTCIALLLLLF